MNIVLTANRVSACLYNHHAGNSIGIADGMSSAYIDVTGTPFGCVGRGLPPIVPSHHAPMHVYTHVYTHVYATCQYAIIAILG